MLCTRPPSTMLRTRQARPQVDVRARLSVPSQIGGVGKVTEKCLREAIGVVTCGDLFRERAACLHIMTPHTSRWLIKVAPCLSGLFFPARLAPLACDSSCRDHGSRRSRRLAAVAKEAIIVSAIELNRHYDTYVEVRLACAWCLPICRRINKNKTAGARKCCV